MKKLYVINYILVALILIGTAVLLFFTPDTVPVHYNFAGEADRFGSKYESLVLPIISVVMVTIFLLVARGQRQKTSPKMRRLSCILQFLL